VQKKLASLRLQGIEHVVLCNLQTSGRAEGQNLLDSSLAGARECKQSLLSGLTRSCSVQTQFRQACAASLVRLAAASGRPLLLLHLLRLLLLPRCADAAM
jgi:hypothetical protein